MTCGCCKIVSSSPLGASPQVKILSLSLSAQPFFSIFNFQFSIFCAGFNFSIFQFPFEPFFNFQFSTFQFSPYCVGFSIFNFGFQFSKLKRHNLSPLGRRGKNGAKIGQTYLGDYSGHSWDISIRLWEKRKLLSFMISGFLDVSFLPQTMYFYPWSPGYLKKSNKTNNSFLKSLLLLGISTFRKYFFSKKLEKMSTERPWGSVL